MQLKPEQRQALDMISARTGMTISETVRWFLDKGILDQSLLKYAGPQEETGG